MSLYSNYFFHGMTRKYQVVFGSLFQNLQVKHWKDTGDVKKVLNVSVMHSPKEKFVQRLIGDIDPDSDGETYGRRRTALTLPAMSFEMTDIIYDGQRKFAKNNYIRHRGENSIAHHTFVPSPYTLQFELSIVTSTIDEMHQIVEQILPAFDPVVVITVRGIEGIDFDVPIDFNGISSSDSYDGGFEDRRQIMWSMSFTMKAYYFAPVRKREIILDVNADIFRLYNDMDIDNAESIESFNANIDSPDGEWEIK